MSGKFDAVQCTTNEVFTREPVPFVIPPHQREYAWTKAEVQQLLDDIFDPTEMARDDHPHYFLGPIMVIREEDDGTPPSATPYEILDGQQRLVTISLLIAALRDRLLAVSPDPAEVAGIVGGLEQVITAGRVTDSARRTKLKLQPRDDTLFEDLIRNGSRAAGLTDASNRWRPLAQAWRYISDFLTQPDLADPDRLKQLVDRVLYEVEFIQIKAGDSASAYSLFESLNYRGLDLNAADLLKNKLLSMIDRRRVADWNERWLQSMAKVGEGEVISFLRHFYIAEHEFVRKDKLYPRARALLDASRRTARAEGVATSFIKNIEKSAETYRAIVDPKWNGSPWPSAVQRSLDRLQRFGAKSFRPVILVTQSRARSKLPKLLSTIEAVTVRYSVIGANNPNKLEIAYGGIADRIRKGGDPASAAQAELGSLTPDDDEFTTDFENFQVGKVTTQIRAILEGLHEQATGGATTPGDPDQLWVEHILPRSLSKRSLSHSGLTLEEGAALVGLFGNLTFLLKEPNILATNDAFPDKVKFYRAAKGLPLTTELTKITRWDADAIKERGRRLARLALKRWPAPNS